MPSIKEFITKHYRHFNAAVVVDAARGWNDLLDKNGKMFLAMGGAMSTAELGISLAELIRQDKVHALSVTGANIEEDIFNLVAHESYLRIPNYRDLTRQQEEELLSRKLNRVTDTCIPEEEAMKKIDLRMLRVWQQAEAAGIRKFPYEHFYDLLRSGELEPLYEIDPKHSWMLAACEKNLPVYVAGWEDSTLGNTFVSHVKKGELEGYSCVKGGLELMDKLMDWYEETDKHHPIGFFQIAGGISGDFPICVVPLLQQELASQCRRWQYFCQISDSTTSYGSYSGAIPNEKISWCKLDVNTPSFVIESDATIVFPLIAAYLLDQ